MPQPLQAAVQMLLEGQVDAHVIDRRSTGIGIDLLHQLPVDERYFVAAVLGPLAMLDLLLEGEPETRQRM